ncbi:hypothetical protein KSC_111090 [Ktedonobacter sp. SOSP1-52]|nr:hypothetical protein KSC_111090 [Ktedonobacter sp. SOSP1-52]
MVPFLLTRLGSLSSWLPLFLIRSHLVPFFARKTGEQVALETIAVSQAEQLTTLRFRVRKA